MPIRDVHHQFIRTALVQDGWEITADPYVISYGERFLFIDLGAVERSFPQSQIIGAQRDGCEIAIEIKEFRGRSLMADLEQAIGQYVLYQLLLNRVDPERELYLAILDSTYEAVFSEPVGELVVQDLPLKLVVIDSQTQEVSQWIPFRPIEKSSRN